MTSTTNRGPGFRLGPLLGNVVVGSFPGSTATSGSQVDILDPKDGPGADYQGTGMADPRFVVAHLGGVASIPTFYSSSPVVIVDALPTAGTATPVDIAPLANATSLVALPLVTAQPSAANNGQCAHMPSASLVPAGTSSAVTVFAIEMGFCYGTTTTGGSAATVTVLDSTLFYPGQWICIGGAGNSGATIPLLTQVQTLATATTITINPVALGAVTRAPISSTNFFQGNPPTNGPTSGPGVTVGPLGVSPYWSAGTAKLFNPLEGISRGIAINGATGSAGGAFIISGYDIWGVPMHETITHPGGAAVAYGLKAWKYITSVIPQFSDAHNYSCGVADVIGFNLRVDKFEYCDAWVNGSPLTASTGFIKALQPSAFPATNTTADVRGTLNIGSLNGPGTGASGGPLSSGVKRVTITYDMPVFNATYANPNDNRSLFGTPQV